MLSDRLSPSEKDTEPREVCARPPATLHVELKSTKDAFPFAPSGLIPPRTTLVYRKYSCDFRYTVLEISCCPNC